MLFVSLLRPKQGTARERAERRAQWKPPEGVKQVAEYWLQSSSVNVVYVFEADSVEQIMPIRIHWIDFYDIETFPAITGEEGLQLAQKML